MIHQYQEDQQDLARQVRRLVQLLLGCHQLLLDPGYSQESKHNTFTTHTQYTIAVFHLVFTGARLNHGQIGHVGH